MTIFGHISVFISIILGLAVVHVLSGLSLILDTRKQSKVYWVHLLWTFNMLFAVVLIWISSFALSPIEDFRMFHFINLLAYAIVTYLMSGLLFPVQGEEVVDFREHFTSNRKRFFILGIIYVFVDAADGVLEHFETGIPLDIGQFGTLSVWLIFFTISVFKDTKFLNTLVAIIFTIGLIGWLVSIIDTGILVW
ncbi:MAG: hypothetical protein ABJG33_14480 [Balneola sp.]